MRKISTLAELAFRKWISANELEEKEFELKMFGNTGIITDKNGASIELTYNSKTREVSVE